MKILIASQYFLYPSCNGASQLSRRVVEALVQLGNEVRVICINPEINESEPECNNYPLRECKQDGVHVYSLPNPDGRFADTRPLALFRAFPEKKEVVSGLMKSWKPDVVSVISTGGLREVFQVANEEGIPLVLTTIDFMMLCPRFFLLKGDGSQCKGSPSVGKCLPCLKYNDSELSQLGARVASFPIFRLLMRAILGKERADNFDWSQAIDEVITLHDDLRANVDRFIAPAPIAREIYEKHGVSPSRITDLVYSLPDSKLELVRTDAENYSPDRRLRIGYIGRPSHEKGFHIILESFMNDSHFNLEKSELWIAGSGLSIDKLMEYGTRKEEIKNAVQSGRIVLYEGLGDIELRDLVAKLDLCVIPSICYECTPLVLLEALAQKTPCVGSDTGGIRHMILNEQSGKVFPPGDVEALTAILNEISSNPGILDEWRNRIPEVDSDLVYARKVVSILEDVINNKLKVGV